MRRDGGLTWIEGGASRRELLYAFSRHQWEARVLEENSSHQVGGRHQGAHSHSTGGKLYRRSSSRYQAARSLNHPVCSLQSVNASLFAVAAAATDESGNMNAEPKSHLLQADARVSRPICPKLHSQRCERAKLDRTRSRLSLRSSAWS